MDVNPASDKENQVLNWYQERWNNPVFLSRTKPALNLETSLSTGRYPWDTLEAENIMSEYFELFNVSTDNFRFLDYWPEEGGFLENLFGSADYDEPKPLTIKMLVESAKAGKWLY